MLERIAVEGTTTSRDFQLDLAGQPMPLRTAFKATVDGTRGDVLLDDVDATLGESRIRAHGSVSSTPGAKGRTVPLTVTMKDARFEDLLRLVGQGRRAADARPARHRHRVRAAAGARGRAATAARCGAASRFAAGRFASDTAQNKIDELSRRGRGEPGNAEVSNVISAFGGAFTLRDGVLRLPGLRFSVQGARVDLDGRYSLRDQGLDFTGALRLDAPVSQHRHRVQVDPAQADRSAVPPQRCRHAAADPHLRHGESARASAWTPRRSSPRLVAAG